MTNTLTLSGNIAEFDDFYELLIDTHQGLDDAQSGMLNAQLILILSNHIGELDVLRQALTLARANVMAPQ
jgi:hypothetical protein